VNNECKGILKKRTLWTWHKDVEKKKDEEYSVGHYFVSSTCCYPHKALESDAIRFNPEFYSQEKDYSIVSLLQAGNNLKTLCHYYQHPIGEIYLIGEIEVLIK